MSQATNLSPAAALRNNGRMVRLQGLISAVLVCLLAAAGVLRAEPGSGGLADPIEQATSAFSSLDFEGALEHADSALRLPGNTTRDLVRIHALRALCLLSLGRQAEAEQAFTAVLSLDPAFRLGPDVSPRYSQPFQQLIEHGVAALEVDVAPPDDAIAGKPMYVRVRLVHDPAQLADHLRFHLRLADGESYRTLRFSLVRGKRLRVALPADTWRQPGTLEWYAEVRDRHGGLLALKGDAEHPLRLDICPEPETAPPPPVAPLAAVVPPPPQAAVVADNNDEADAPAWYERWWVWALIGGAAVAVAAGTTAGVLAADDGASRRDFTLVIE